MPNENRQTQVPRELIAFAFVEDEYSRTGDIVRGLMPIFVPILSKTPNRRFEAKEFADQVEKIYDIPMSPLVAEGLVPKLAEVGLLYRESEQSQTYRISAQSEGSMPVDTGIDALVSDFIAFATVTLTPLQIAIEPSRLEEALLRRFTNMKFLAFLERPEKNYFKGNTITLKKPEKEVTEEINIEQAMDVLCADYALQIAGRDAVKFGLLCKMAGGALISEVVLTLQTPSSANDLANVTVFLDGPLILDYLDLSTPELKDYATDLFELINKAGVKKATFLHTVEEMRGTINGPLEALQRGDQPFGPLGTRILRDKHHAAYARAVLDDMATHLASKNIKIIDAEQHSSEAHQKYCPRELEESLRNNLGPVHYNLERRVRDALSVATVLRIRSNPQHPVSVTEAHEVFVTRNENLSERTRKYLLFKRCLSERELPPAITDRQLAGLFWFAVGGNLGQLSRKKLIANCTFVLNPRIDIVSKMRQFLYEIDPGKAEMFSVLMRDKRAQRTLVHTTLGFPSLITPDNAEEILDEIRRSTAADERQAAQEREINIRDEYEGRLSTQTQVHRTVVQEKETQILQFQEKQREMGKQQEGLNERLDVIDEQYKKDIDRRVERAAHSAKRMKLILQSSIVLTYGLIVFITYGIFPKIPWVGPAVALVLGICGFWVVPHLLFEPILKRTWTWRFEARAKDLDVASKLDQYEVDASRGIVRRKDSQ